MSTADEYHEYYRIQDVISNYNENCLEIKKWSVTTASFVAVVGEIAGTALAVKLTTIIVLSLAFWLTETVWRVNQWSFIRRVQQLEELDPQGPQMSSRWTRFYFGKTRTEEVRSDPAHGWDRDEGEASPRARWGHFISPRAALPHALIALVAFGLLVAEAFGAFPTRTTEPTRQRIEGTLGVTLTAPAGESRH